MEEDKIAIKQGLTAEEDKTAIKQGLTAEEDSSSERKTQGIKSGGHRMADTTQGPCTRLSLH